MLKFVQVVKSSFSLKRKGGGDVWGIAMASIAAAYSGHSAVGDTDAPVSGKCKISLSFFGYHLV